VVAKFESGTVIKAGAVALGPVVVDGGGCGR